MPQKKVLIIGGGIAGLCAGVYLRKSGFETEILEMHTSAGGLATAWKRKGYTFENCVHWLVGSREGRDLHSAWKEVFDIGRLEFFEDEIYQVIEKGPARLVIYRDVDRMEKELLAQAPEDADAIRELAALVRKLASLRMPSGDSFLALLASFLKFLPGLPALRKYSKLTMSDFAARFREPRLKSFFGSGIGDLSFLGIAFALAWMTNRNAGYPVGGSPRLIGLIEDRYRELGGTIRFGAKVEKIIVDDGRAAGVVLADGRKERADIVVSASDGHATIFTMLEGKFLSEKIRKIYETYKPFPSYVQVSFGVADPLRGEPGFISLMLDNALVIDPETKQDTLVFRIFNFDPTFSPAGKTAVVCFLATFNDGYWTVLRESDRPGYDAEKKRIADEVLRYFTARFTAAAGKIEIVDVATPATVVRYTGNWKGSMEGWLMTPATGIRSLPAVLPGLRNFYMVGQWTSPGGGLPSGLMTARAVSRRICRDNRVPWKPL